MRFIDPDGCQIILGGPALNIGIGKFSATLLNISDLQDGYILGSALVSSITGRAPTSFEITTNEYGVFNGVVFQPVSSDDIEVAKSGLLLPAVSGATVNKIGNKIDDVADAMKNRVRPRQGTKMEIREAALKTKDGKYLDPNTGKPIENGQEVFGHKTGHEWSKYKNDPTNISKTRKEVIEDQNNPNIYQIEDRKSNASHKYEEKSIK